jgi:hypothetical protein
MLLSELLKDQKDSQYMLTSDAGTFREEDHPRGQPGNAGQFGPGGGSKSEATQANPEDTHKFLRKVRRELRKGLLTDEQKIKYAKEAVDLIIKDPEATPAHKERAKKYIEKIKEIEKQLKGQKEEPKPEKKDDPEPTPELKPAPKAEEKASVAAEKKEATAETKSMLDKPASAIREHLFKKNNEYRAKIEPINNRIAEIEAEILKKSNEVRKENPDKYYEIFYNTPEYIEGWKEKNKLTAERTEIHAKRRAIVLDAIKQPPENRGQVDMHVYSNAPGGKKVKKWADKTLSAFLEHVHKDAIGGVAREHIEIIRGVRAHFSDRDGIALGSKNESTLIHEFGHYIEHTNKEVAKACRSFRFSRTKDEPKMTLRKATGISHYSEDEVTKKDDFFDAYVGKFYKNGSTEILSMGLEKMMADPLGFAKKDPEHFDLIIDIMRGKYKEG